MGFLLVVIEDFIHSVQDPFFQKEPWGFAFLKNLDETAFFGVYGQKHRFPLIGMDVKAFQMPFIVSPFRITEIGHAAASFSLGVLKKPLGFLISFH